MYYILYKAISAFYSALIIECKLVMEYSSFVLIDNYITVSVEE